MAALANLTARWITLSRDLRHHFRRAEIFARTVAAPLDLELALGEALRPNQNLPGNTDQRAGAKFAAADLIGIPWQILVGPKGLAEGKLEIKRRSDSSRENLNPAEVMAKIAG